MQKYNEREITAHSRLRGREAILQMYSYVKFQQFDCLVMELCNGGDLENYKN